MDAITPKPKRRSRTSTAPIIRSDGTIYEVRERDLIESDDRKLEILARYEGLPIPYTLDAEIKKLKADLAAMVAAASGKSRKPRTKKDQQQQTLPLNGGA
jgi:hypothetical protein